MLSHVSTVYQVLILLLHLAITRCGVPGVLSAQRHVMVVTVNEQTDDDKQQLLADCMLLSYQLTHDS